MAGIEDEGGCVTLTWELQNFSLFLSLEEGSQCWTTVWKTEHNETSAWRRLRIQITDLNFYVSILSASECMNLDSCEMSLISSCREDPLELLDYEDSDYLTYFVERDDVFSEKRQLITPNDTLTLRCKMWDKTIKPQEFCIKSVLHSFSYLWNIENFKTSKYYSRYIEKENLVFSFSLESHKGGTHKLVFSIVTYNNAIVSFSNIKISDNFNCVSVIDKYYSLNDWIYLIEISHSGTLLNLQLEFVFAVHKVCQDPFKLSSAHHYENVSEAVSGALGDDFLLLYRDKLFSDATLNAKGRSFHVHRNILSARSPVFRSMFEKNEMSEGRSGAVEIDDVDSETVDRMLVYLYGDMVESVQQWEEASALYYAADKYDIQPLKHKCANSLKVGLTVENICETLVLADRHSDDQLMKCIVDFIRQHEDVILSEKWDNLENSNPLLSSKILRKICGKNRKK